MKKNLILALLALPVFSAPLPESVTASVDQICFFTSERGRYPAQGNRLLPWVTSGENPAKALKIASNPIHSSPGQRIPPPDSNLSLAIFRYRDGSFAALYPVPFQAENGDWLLTRIKLDNQNGFTVEASAFDGKPASAPPQYVIGKSHSVYGAVQSAVNQAMNLPWLKGSYRPLAEKKDPEIFRYLGWCSWEQYKKAISEKKLVAVAKALKASPVPIRWMLVDDGFQQRHNQDRLQSFEPRPDTFPGAWKPLIAERNEKLRWFGAWHAYYGYWGGISPENTLPEAVKTGLFEINTWIYPGKTRADAQTYFDGLIGSLKDYGFDFAKIDVQCQYLDKIQGHPQAISRNIWMTQALEEACGKTGLDLMNCMAMGGVMHFFTSRSASMRCSIDYQLDNADMARSHLWQSYHNALWLGMSLQPDHDMFHSSDKLCGGMMARSKALSGGAVYISDAPSAMNPALILPLAAADGKILRPLHAGVPLPDSIFIDPLNEAKPYRVAAPLPGATAAICLYNLLAPGKERITARITPQDYLDAFAFLPQAPAQPRAIALFDSTTQKGTLLTETFTCSIPAFSDRLFILAPIQNGWGVIGRTDKYLSPCMVSEINASAQTLTLTLTESGPVVIYSKEKPALGNHQATDLGEGFWKFDLPLNNLPKVLIFTR